jgi:hypothetical protein
LIRLKRSTNWSHWTTDIFEVMEGILLLVVVLFLADAE